jgi:hypothetical protein
LCGKLVPRHRFAIAQTPPVQMKNLWPVCMYYGALGDNRGCPYKLYDNPHWIALAMISTRTCMCSSYLKVGLVVTLLTCLWRRGKGTRALLLAWR